MTGLPLASMSDAACGFLMSGSMMKVKIVMKTRINAWPPTVQPTLQAPLPWIWAATMPPRARNLNIAHTRAPATPMKTIQARMKISR